VFRDSTGTISIDLGDGIANLDESVQWWISKEVAKIRPSAVPATFYEVTGD
jgi:hypothetical protein